MRTSCAPFRFHFHCCRNISCPEDTEYGRKVLSGHAPASSFLDLEDNENVREYLVDLPGKQKRSPTLVHQAIRETLNERTDLFSILNGGICIVARNVEIIERDKVLNLFIPSIINGSQTQGELKRYFRLNDGNPPKNPSVSFQIITTSDDGLIAEISIARNFQNDVRPISIAGRRGELNELEDAIQKIIPKAKLRKSESDVSEEYLDTEKLIQVLFALSPESIWEAFDESRRITSKSITYSQKTRCLKLFETVYQNKEAPPYKELYKFFIDMAAVAWSTYTTWKKHDGFIGTRIRCIERENGRTISEVPDGIVFPIIASFSAFIDKKENRWTLSFPDEFDEKEIIDAAAEAFKDIAKHDPQQMGKLKACYSSLHRITSIYARFYLQS